MTLTIKNALKLTALKKPHLIVWDPRLPPPRFARTLQDVSSHPDYIPIFETMERDVGKVFDVAIAQGDSFESSKEVKLVPTNDPNFARLLTSTFKRIEVSRHGRLPVTAGLDVKRQRRGRRGRDTATSSWSALRGWRKEVSSMPSPDLAFKADHCAVLQLVRHR